MADSATTSVEDRAEMKSAAISLFEIGEGAYRRNDVLLAEAYLLVAGRLFEKIDDLRNAEKARHLARNLTVL